MSDHPTPDRAPSRPRWVWAMIITGVIVVVLAILAVAGVLPGGPEGHGPGRHMGEGDATRPAGQSSGNVGVPADAETADRTIEVTTLDTMAFEPSSLSVAPGETVTFVVTNGGNGVHDFTLGDAAMQKEHADAMEHMPSGMSHDFPNSITLEPGETEQLTWRFGDAQTLEYACHQPDHYESGMRGVLSVT
jgi:uncharacterized cupredoxin-like copper-binding protein